MENHAYTDRENNIQPAFESQLRDALDTGKFSLFSAKKGYLYFLLNH